MAYLTFPELGGSPAAASTATLAATRLSALEWSVVALARRDRRSSLRAPGRLTVAIRKLLDGRNPRLADPRLEALRRIAVLSWHDGYTVASDEVRAFMAAGFTSLQYEAMVDRIGAARTKSARWIAQ